MIELRMYFYPDDSLDMVLDQGNVLGMIKFREGLNGFHVVAKGNINEHIKQTLGEWIPKLATTYVIIRIERPQLLYHDSKINTR
jgi:hypothetical protein